jgi:hypothetical protein
MLLLWMLFLDPAAAATLVLLLNPQSLSREDQGGRAVAIERPYPHPPLHHLLVINTLLKIKV